MANLGTLLHLEGHVIGGCRLIRRLGVGGMGEVYLAEQARLGNRRVAVKIVRPDGEAGQDYREAARRFLHEGRMLAGFAHPNVLPVHDSGVEDGCFYLVMEYAPDGSLKDALCGRGPHPLPFPVEVSLAVEIVSQIAAALHYTHERGIVHGDVKPGNVLVEMEPDGHRRMLLADYGVARELEATAQVSKVTGTVAYMAPEQFSGVLSPATDQYALAVVAYQLLAGRTPFEGGFAEQMRGHLDRAPAPLRAINPTVSRSVELVIRRALAKDPAERFPSVLAFADALELALRAETESTVFGAPGAWEETVTVRPALAGRRQQSPRPRDARASVGMQRTHQPPGSAGSIFFANESATEHFPYAAPATRHLSQRRLGIFATCAALLLVAMLVAVGTNSTRNTHALGANTQDIAAGGGHPKGPANTTPVAGRPSTLTPSPSSTPNAIESDFAGDAFTVAGVAAPSSVAPGQPIVASITLTNSGFNTWTSAVGYRLTCDTLHMYPARSNCPTGFAASLAQYVVAPGASITFTLTLTAPSAIGAYNAWFSMAHGDALFSTMKTARLSLAVQYPAPTVTPQPTNTPMPQPTNTPQPAPTNTPQPQPTDTPTPQPTDTPTPQPTPTDTPQPTPTDTPIPTPTAQATDTPLATSTVVSTDTPADISTPSVVPISSTFPLSLWQAM